MLSVPLLHSYLLFLIQMLQRPAWCICCCEPDVMPFCACSSLFRSCQPALLPYVCPCNLTSFKLYPCCNNSLNLSFIPDHYTPIIPCSVLVHVCSLVKIRVLFLCCFFSLVLGLWLTGNGATDEIHPESVSCECSAAWTPTSDGQAM